MLIFLIPVSYGGYTICFQEDVETVPACAGAVAGVISPDAEWENSSFLDNSDYDDWTYDKAGDKNIYVNWSIPSATQNVTLQVKYAGQAGAGAASNSNFTFPAECLVHGKANDNKLIKTYQLCANLGIPVIIHTGPKAVTWQWMKYNKPIFVDDIATNFPDLKIVMCHGGYPWTEEFIAVVYTNPNILVDLIR